MNPFLQSMATEGHNCVWMHPKRLQGRVVPWNILDTLLRPSGIPGKSIVGYYASAFPDTRGAACEAQLTSLHENSGGAARNRGRGTGRTRGRLPVSLREGRESQRAGTTGVEPMAASGQLSRRRPAGRVIRANSRTSGNIGGGRRGGPLLTAGPPVRDG